MILKCLKPIILWVVSIFFLVLVDYAFRSANGLSSALYLNELLWFGIPLLIGALCALWLFAILKPFTLKKILIGFLLIVGATVFYLGFILFYITGTGVDSF